MTTVREELEHNKRLTKSEDEFVTIMNSLNLPYPKQIGDTLRVNSHMRFSRRELF